MKKKILPIFTFAALSISSYCQVQKNIAFAITGATKGNYNWNVIREIDLSSGQVTRTLYDPAVNKTINYKDALGSELKAGAATGSATGAGVAAAAYDALHNRLYFTNMRGNALSYFDLAGNDLSVVVNNSAAFNTGNKNDEANVITRMAFAADGNGYALTNDSKNFIRFTTDQKPTVTNLGELIDGSKNGNISVHNQCSSWGGDIVGDAYGSLYLVTYRNHVFKISPKTRVADYIGQIKGIPAQYTSNGVVVDNDGDMIVTSAIETDNYYRVNISTLTATPVAKKDQQLFNSSDLANGNLLYQTKATDKFITSEVRGNQAVSVFPNPVANKTFSVQFDAVPAGKYNFILTDASGRTVVSRALTIAVKGQVEQISLPRASAGGMYMVKLTSTYSDSKVIYNDKLVVQ